VNIRRIRPHLLPGDQLLLFEDQPVLAKVAEEGYGFFHIGFAHEHIAVLVEGAEVNLILIMLRLVLFDVLQVDKIHIF
jgi:hypothetical protein